MYWSGHRYLQYSGDHRSGDAQPSLTFSVFTQVLTLCAFTVDGAEFGGRWIYVKADIGSCRSGNSYYA